MDYGDRYYEYRGGRGVNKVSFPIKSGYHLELDMTPEINEK